MIYIFKKAFRLKDGSIIQKGDPCFYEPEEVNEITEAIKADKGEVETKAPKKKEQ